MFSFVRSDAAKERHETDVIIVDSIVPERLGRGFRLPVRLAMEPKQSSARRATESVRFSKVCNSFSVHFSWIGRGVMPDFSITRVFLFVPMPQKKGSKRSSISV